MASKVFFTDFRTTHDQSLTVKLKKLIRRAGICLLYTSDAADE